MQFLHSSQFLKSYSDVSPISLTFFRITFILHLQFFKVYLQIYCKFREISSECLGNAYLVFRMFQQNVSNIFLKFFLNFFKIFPSKRYYNNSLDVYISPKFLRSLQKIPSKFFKMYKKIQKFS